MVVNGRKEAENLSMMGSGKSETYHKKRAGKDVRQNSDRGELFFYERKINHKS